MKIEKKRQALVTSSIAPIEAIELLRAARILVTRVAGSYKIRELEDARISLDEVINEIENNPEEYKI